MNVDITKPNQTKIKHKQTGITTDLLKNCLIEYASIKMPDTADKKNILKNRELLYRLIIR